MSILEKVNCTIWGYETNEYNVSSYKVRGEIKASIQPVSTKDGFEGNALLNTYKLYSDNLDIVVGDKIEADGKTYIVNSVQEWNGLLRHYLKVFINESNGD